MEVLDKIGQPIVPGCFIAYGVGRGELRIGKVIKVKATPTPTSSHPDRVDYRIGVYGTDMKWNLSLPSELREIELFDKNSTLQFPDRIVVLKREQIAERYLKVLDLVKV